MISNPGSYPESGSCYCLASQHVEPAGYDFNELLWYYRGADHIKDNPKANVNYRDESDSIIVFTSNSDPEKRHKAPKIMNMITAAQNKEWVRLKRSCYVIKLDSINILPEKRLKAYTISDVVYDWARLKRPTKKPQDLPTLMIENHSRIRQVITRTLGEEIAEAESFTITKAKSFDISMEVEGEKGVKIEGGFSSSDADTKRTTRASTNTVSSSISGTVLLI